MDTKKGNISYRVIPTKLAKSASVMVGFKFDSGCYFTLQGLKCGSCKCMEAPYSSALMHGLFRFVRAKIMQTHAEELTSQITSIDSNYQNGEFSITVNCAGTVSGIRKAIVGILKNLKPASMYPAYKDAVKSMDEMCSEKLTVDRKIFTYLAAEMVKSVNKSVVVIIAGKANLKKEQFEKIAASSSVKLNAVMPKGDKLNPKEDSVTVGTCLVKCSGFGAVLTKRYIESKLGTTLYLVDSCLYGAKHHMSALKKLSNKDHIKRHVGSKYKKFKTDLAPALIYLAMVNNLTDTASLIKYSKTKVTGASIVASIESCL